MCLMQSEPRIKIQRMFRPSYSPITKDLRFVKTKPLSRVNFVKYVQ